MYNNLLNNYIMTLQEKRRIVAILYEAKIKEEEIINLLKKYCNIDYEEAINLLQNEKFIDAPCRKLEQFLILEKGYSYKDADVFINKYVINILTKNTELSKITPIKLYDLAMEYKKKKENND